MSAPINQQRHIKRIHKAASEYDNYWDVLELRVKVGLLISKWGGPSLYHLLGYTNTDDITPEQIETLKRIAGPNGFIIYKILCARAQP